MNKGIWVLLLLQCCLILNCASLKKMPGAEKEVLYHDFSEAIPKGEKIKWICYEPYTSWGLVIVISDRETTEDIHTYADILYLFKWVKDKKSWKIFYKETIEDGVIGLYVDHTYWDINLDGKKDIVIYYSHGRFNCVKIYNFNHEKETLEPLIFKNKDWVNDNICGNGFGGGSVYIYDMEFDGIREVVVKTRRSDIDIDVPSILKLKDLDPKEEEKLWQKQWAKDVYKWNGKGYEYSSTIYPPD